MSAPYLQIAEALRERIVSGSLRPGQRVPSTRKIVAEWGVAMATATKALAELRSQGLVEVLPGVGSVVSGPAERGDRTADGADETHPSGLSRAPIVRCAMRIADAEGLDAVSMRRIAGELDAAPMSLYRHVPGKEELLLLMREAAFGDVALPAAVPTSWREELEVSAAALWSVYRLHPWLARTSSLTRPYPGPNQLRYSEWNLRALSGLGLGNKTVLLLHLTLFNLVHGFGASLETESTELADSGIGPDRWMARHDERATTLIGSGSYPYSARVFMDPATVPDQDWALDLDELFGAALATVLDGIAARLQGL
ncbi:GntR family transcriptional regulator [Speluncibacter jeojiensis]|uniref:GntR family transcriptional regulator n=1 Tax=Speluncibacter jeojiensis TaxID=2710754 RepID=A0A9X4M0E0_9ACTN|nr:GntR family transcriptional regulator [Corynebacteriales bacterium D3-21]